MNVDNFYQDDAVPDEAVSIAIGMVMPASKSTQTAENMVGVSGSKSRFTQISSHSKIECYLLLNLFLNLYKYLTIIEIHSNIKYSNE